VNSQTRTNNLFAARRRDMFRWLFRRFSAYLSVAVLALVLTLLVAGAYKIFNSNTLPSLTEPAATQLATPGGESKINVDRAYIQPRAFGTRLENNRRGIRFIGEISIVAVLAALTSFHLSRGPLRIKGGRSGRRVVRFSAFERFVHWLTASTFFFLAISGLYITFSDQIADVMFGQENSASLLRYIKYVHIYISFSFIIGVALSFLIWFSDALPDRVDLRWLKEGGGIFDRKKSPPAYRFNAGQKITYWIVVAASATLSITGFILMFPFDAGLDPGGLYTANLVHGVVAVLFIAVMLAHVYIGSIGLEGAFEGMADGVVDIAWAKQHHRLWIEEEMGEGQRSQLEGARPETAG